MEGDGDADGDVCIVISALDGATTAGTDSYFAEIAAKLTVKVSRRRCSRRSDKGQEGV